MEPNEQDLATRPVLQPVIDYFRPLYQGLMITNGGYDQTKAEQVLATALADLVSFGRPFIANPDLPKRFVQGAPLNEPDIRTFYGRGIDNLEKGYTDYPALV